ncbi:MAG: hypothetical protein KAJ95_05175, partial [Gammaproteobacteria bacterium]|nr:hypothetical protein [Gammaproteobacteria bacterium]
LSSQDLDLSAKVFEQENFYCKPLPQWVSETRREMKMTGPHGINVLLYREYDEDELDILPSLPNELKWDIDADEMTRKLLLSIPITFRASARSRITRVAEADAIIDGLTSVTLEHACRAMFKTAPDFRHELLRETMQAYGLNKIFYDVG